MTGTDGPGPCRRCGCTDDDACVGTWGPCSWISAGLCSACIDLPDGAELIRDERRRQVDVEGFDEVHDRQHTDHGDATGLLVSAAYAYQTGERAYWPWDSASWKPKNKIRDLIRAGALYQAAADLDEIARPKYERDRDYCAHLLDELLVDARTIDRHAQENR